MSQANRPQPLNGNNILERDVYWMQQALLQAQKAEQIGEVPVGAVVVADNQLIATGFNQPITHNDPTAHAEITALRSAGDILKNYRLAGTTLYVTLEPCAMCMGAIIHARVTRLVFGAYDEKTGACNSVLALHQSPVSNHKLEVESGVLSHECAMLLSHFFKRRRNEQKVKKAYKNNKIFKENVRA